MVKRSGKFYNKNEKRVMKLLGLTPVPMSGAGWIHKEDGESDTCIAQLKSTDSDSIRIQKLDLEKLEYHSSVSHKLPIFILQFLSDDSIYAVLPIDCLDKFVTLSPAAADLKSNIILNDKQTTAVKHKVIKSSSSSSRNKFYERREAHWNKQKR